MPTPLLLPGTLCDAALWAGVAGVEGMRVVPVIRGRTLPGAAERAMAGAPEGVHLVGFSLGALLAFEVLRRCPGRVARLTLIGANPHAPTPAQLDTWAEQEREVAAGNFGAVVQHIASSAGGHQRTVLEMARRVGPDAFREQLALLRSRPDSRPALAGYRGPLTLLVGEQDTVTPPHLAREMATLAPQAELHVIPDAGHYLPLDAPGAVSDALRELAHG